MGNIPITSYMLPGGDPIIHMSFGNEKGKLLTDDWGSQFEIQGDIRIASRYVLARGLYWESKGFYAVSFSRFEFDFRNGFMIKARSAREDNPLVFQMIDEMHKIYDNLKVFL